MSHDKNIMQHQIIINNSKLKEANQNDEAKSFVSSDTVNDKIKEAIVVDSVTYQKAQKQVIEKENSYQKTKKKPILWPVIIILSLILMVIEFVNFVLDHISSSPIVTSIYITLFLCFVVMFVGLLVKELYGLYQLKKQQTLRISLSELFAKPLSQSSITSTKQAKKICVAVQHQLACDLPLAAEQQWQLSLNNNVNEQELIQLFDVQILSHVDKKAIADIAKYSSETMLLVTISPLAFIDMFIVLWRNIKMINKISGLYGLKLGYWSRLKLIKQVFNDMLLVGASELAIDLGSQALSADLLGKLSGRMAQGFGAGMLTARLGINTLKASRPMPFIEETPQLSHIRKALLDNIKSSIFNKNTINDK